MGSVPPSTLAQHNAQLVNVEVGPQLENVEVGTPIEVNVLWVDENGADEEVLASTAENTGIQDGVESTTWNFRYLRGRLRTFSSAFSIDQWCVTGCYWQRRTGTIWQVHVPRTVPPGGKMMVACGHSKSFPINIPVNFRHGDGKMLRTRIPPEVYNSKACRTDLPTELVPGQRFYVVVGSLLVLLVCPDSYIPGQRLHFKVPYVHARWFTITVPDHHGSANCLPLKICNRSAEYFPAHPFAAGQTFQISTAQLLSPPCYKVCILPNRQTGRPFLVRAGEKIIAVKPTTISSDLTTILFSLPFDEVEGESLRLVDCITDVPGESCWKMLPTDLLAQVLDFLSVKQVREWRFANLKFAVAGKKALEFKLRRVGVDGTCYEQLVGTATAFVHQAEQERRAVEQVRCYAESFSRNRSIQTSYIPGKINDLRTVQRIKMLCELTEETHPSGENAIVGMVLGRAGLSLYVWVEQYRQELERQLFLLPESFSETRKRALGVLKVISSVQEAGVRMVLANYIPKLQHWSSSEETTTTFERVEKMFASGSLFSEYERKVDGVGRSPGILAGVNLRHTGLMASVSRNYLLDSALSTIHMIDRHVRKNKQKLFRQ